VFSRMVGVSYGTFMLLLAKLEAAFNDYQSEQLTRKRGKKSSMPLADQLLLCLLYLRTYDTFLNLSFQFGISESYAQKRYTFVKKLLLQALDLPDEESLRDAINGEHVAVDVTEQAIERPIENQEQYYSGKKKLHTIKVLLIVCLLTNLIKAIRFDRGPRNDYQMYKNSKFDLSKHLKISADSGFQGIKDLHEKSQIPHKASKLKPLNDTQKEHNKKIASKRIPIEHTNRKCKIFKICGSRFRGKHKNYESTWTLIAALVNFKESTRHLRFQSP